MAQAGNKSPTAPRAREVGRPWRPLEARRVRFAPAFLLDPDKGLRGLPGVGVQVRSWPPSGRSSEALRQFEALGPRPAYIRGVGSLLILIILLLLLLLLLIIIIILIIMIILINTRLLLLIIKHESQGLLPENGGRRRG